ncbi:MAG TPA: copper-containing nitrite reductase [Candidatus Sulfotelmatobacter sp.]|jgi:nitrite reductase (NO-forming)|nr:copper-containing nitrite reductase [Candidatus Sulfotelmatobacter sp.]
MALFRTCVRSTLFPLCLLLSVSGIAGAEEMKHDMHAANSSVHGRADITFTLRTGIADGKMAFIGRGGDIDGKVNPVLNVREGDQVQINLINGEGAEHDIVVPDFHAASQHVVGKGASSSIVFQAGSPGSFTYYCSIPGHREAGMQGAISIAAAPAGATPDAGASIDRDPSDLPPPVGDRAPTTLRVDLETIERIGRLDDRTTYSFWTFNGKVPGPFLRARVGDTIELHLKNDKNSMMNHSIDLHAVNGTGGGAVFTETEPGQERGFVFKALTPGLFVYHCATPMVANHISNGMYGLILIEPAGGLPKVDHEFYVMQGELYTTSPFGTPGQQEFDLDKLVAERPDYFTFNGSVGALSKDHPLQSKVGDSVRIFFGDGGPNFTSSFHVIGQIFDRAYEDGGLTSQPLTGVQTISVPPGSAAMVEFTTKVPGRFTIVDHALSRLEKGLAGSLIVSGPEQPDIFREVPVNKKP